MTFIVGLLIGLAGGLFIARPFFDLRDRLVERFLVFATQEKPLMLKPLPAYVNPQNGKREVNDV